MLKPELQELTVCIVVNGEKLIFLYATICLCLCRLTHHLVEFPDTHRQTDRNTCAQTNAHEYSIVVVYNKL